MSFSCASRVFAASSVLKNEKKLSLDKSHYTYKYSAQLIRKRGIFKKHLSMPLLRIICWAIIFLTRIRFPPGVSIAGNLLLLWQNNQLRDRSLFIPGVGTEEIWVG
jgi:hypothetical protein